MAFKHKYSLVNELANADEELMGSNSMYGLSAMTYPEINNGSRVTMDTSHIKQCLTLINPEFAMMYTGMENVVGKYSTSSYKKARTDFIVYRKIVKFGDIIDNPQVYKLFLYDPKNNYYDVIERNPCENLTEVFGFDYNNDAIDQLSEGDTVKEGDVLYKSTSYDDDMNYCYGKNVNVMYTLAGPTSEDACIVSKSFAKDCLSIEADTISVQLNDNDYLVNLRGDDKHYKPLPDIGEITSDYFAAVRRQFNEQLLFDFKSSSLREPKNGDKLFYLNGETEILDYTIYNNSEDLGKTKFDAQINMYYVSQTKYYEDIKNTCETIMNSGAEYSQNLDYAYKRALEMLDNDKKWKRGDSAFSNKEIVATIRKVCQLSTGQKITGRYGNKSVISEIWDDDKMPFTEDGRRIDLLLNLLAIMNRTTMGPLYEPAITGIADKIRVRMKSLKSLTQKAELMFDFIHKLNEKYADEMRAYYDSLSEKDKEAFINSAINDGIYVHVQNTWDSTTLIERMKNIFSSYDWIDYDTVYINLHGWKRKCMCQSFIGRMYILKLKQSGRKGFSARSMEAVNSEGVPTRSHKNKTHQETNSSSPIRFGEYEYYAFNIGMIPDDIAMFYVLYRTSVKGRKYLMESMYCNEEEKLHQLPSSFTSRVAEILGVYFKSVGIRLDFVDPANEVTTLDDDYINQYTDSETKETVFCTQYEKFLLDRYSDCMAEIMVDYPVIENDELQARINAKLISSKYVMGTYDPINEVNDLLKKLHLRDKDYLEIYKEKTND